VYVQTLPKSDKKWQVSTSGGMSRVGAPMARHALLSEDRKLMAATVGAGPSFRCSSGFIPISRAGKFAANRTHFVPSDDGRRFLVNIQSADSADNPSRW
jgi:hypothetical protein